MLKRVSLIGAGWLLLIAGVAGLFLPVLPGIPLLFVGLSILSVEYEWARRVFASVRRRFPAAHRKLQTLLPKGAKPTSA